MYITSIIGSQPFKPPTIARYLRICLAPSPANRSAHCTDWLLIVDEGRAVCGIAKTDIMPKPTPKSGTWVRLLPWLLGETYPTIEPEGGELHALRG